MKLEMNGPEVVYENRHTELLAFPLNHRVSTYGFIIREKKPYNIRKEAIAQYGLNLTEIGTLKRGEDVFREDGTVIPNAEAAYVPYEPRSYAYCSDTAPFPELADWVRGVTVMYHESTFPAEMEEMAASCSAGATQASTVLFSMPMLLSSPSFRSSSIVRISSSRFM